MSTVTFRRPPRRPGPPPPQGELALQEPPPLPETQGAMGGIVTYFPMALSSMGMVLIFLKPESGGGSVLTYVAIGMMAMSAVAMLVSQFVRSASDRKRKLRGERRDYLRYLATSRRRVRKVVQDQRQAQTWRHPDPTALWTLARTDRLWERRTSHQDFAEIRIATGAQSLATPLAPLSTKPVEDLEPLSAHALRRFVRAYTSVPGMPVAVRLRTYAQIVLTPDGTGTSTGAGTGTAGAPRTGGTPAGPEHAAARETARAMVRALLGQLAVLHAPGEAAVVVVADGEARPAWEWVKWLPHAQHPVDRDAVGPVRLVAETVSELEQLLGEEFTGRPPFSPDAAPSRDEPYTVVVLDTGSVPADARVAGTGYRNTVVIDVRGVIERKAPRTVLRLRVTPDALHMAGTDHNGHDTESPVGKPDVLGPEAALALARSVARYRPGTGTQSAQPLETDMELTGLLGVLDLHGTDLDRLRERGAADRLRVPIGLGADGGSVLLDIKESAQGGMGPHGMLIGATGSGKSELLRTLVLALAMTHTSETLNFVLVDFKGGATFLGLDRLPHTSAVITNLADEAALVERMKDALHGELIRRQELLRRAGSYASALDYERARAGGADLAPLPTLFVVVDEFSELLAAHRDFMELFVMIGRLGRSLGVHLLLASQRLDEGRMHQLESHLSYRIGLRTFSAMESRSVLGVPDAYTLPSQPGSGLLKNDVGSLTRFKAAYVSGPYRRRARGAARQAVVAGQVTPFTAAWAAPRRLPAAVPDPVPEAETGTAPSLLDVALDRLREIGGPDAHPVWLPPLDTPVALASLLPPLTTTAARGFGAAPVTGSPAGPTLRVPIGVVDRPFDQRRDPLLADLSGAGGHVGVAGGPQSGKSTLLRTLVASLALTHTPREVQFHGLDFGGGTLTALAALPHVGTVTGRLDPERVRRTVAEVTALMARRERLFADHGVETMADYRRRRAAGEFADEPYGDVFLVVDGWGTVRQDFSELLPVFNQISARGLNFGVHLVVASTRWGEMSGALRDQLGTRFELRLGDPVDSMINMRAASGVPTVPGRGLTAERLHFLTALPRLDEPDGPGTGSGDAHPGHAEGFAALARSVAEAWQGPSAPPVRMLPLTLPATALPAPEGDLRVPLGVEDQRLETFWHDFEASPHLLVVGDAESGKTNLLALIARAVVARYGPDEARVMTVDLRRTLSESVPEAHRLGYAVSAEQAKKLVLGAAQGIAERVPGPEIGPERLARRDWWKGPRLFLVVDDHEMLGGGGLGAPSPFAPLFDHLVQSTELGLHLIVARSANGASRALSDPLLRKLLEVNTPTVMLSCQPSEGAFIGNVKPRLLPPGRGLYITRRGTQQVQTGLVETNPETNPEANEVAG
ncbi:type VII secretion protein EccCa [Streptomyces sp. NBC_01335]|uniref:type VII secretion protein EccCa n=1 Tax=Streptomyces sp. NBC_01335 TaxID=2903828 RepID=UPI002E14ECC3|nr:type VII secretion protein EccCa [Streptomyces sp. NBC_01335]